MSTLENDTVVMEYLPLALQNLATYDLLYRFVVPVETIWLVGAMLSNRLQPVSLDDIKAFALTEFKALFPVLIPESEVEVWSRQFLLAEIFECESVRK